MTHERDAVTTKLAGIGSDSSNSSEQDLSLMLSSADTIERNGKDDRCVWIIYIEWF